MSKLLLSALQIFLCSVVHAKVTVEYRISHVHGLLDFVMAVSGEPHHAPALKEIFVKSSFNTAEAMAVLLEIDKCKENLFRNLDGDKGIPSGRRNSVSVLRLMVTQSVFAKDLNDLSQRVLGLLPVDQHLQLFKALRFFEPIYDTLIWQKHQKELYAHKVQLEKIAKKVNLNQMFVKAEKFYGASWPQDAPFTIGLYAVPFLKKFRNSTNSASNGMIEEHGVLVGSKTDDSVGSFGVIFHELCHSVYDAQPVELQNEFEKYFLTNSSPYRSQAYRWINEALATALGNGWAFELAVGRQDSNSWYNDETVEGFSHAIYDLTKSYINMNKSIDQDFVSKAIALFAAKFPYSIYEFKNLFSDIHLVHNGSFMAGPAPQKHVREILEVQNYQGSAPIAHQQTLEGILELNNTVVFVVSEIELKELEKVAESLPFLKANLETIRKMVNRSFWAKLDDKSRGFMVIKVNSEDEFSLALNAIKEAGKIDLKNEVKTF